MKRLIVIAGPTASGKTDLAIQLALRYHTEIISVDSRQFYRELNIGTAKPDKQKLSQVKHHFIDSLSIHDSYSAGRFGTDCLHLMEKLYEKTDVLIACGGSGLFIHSLLYGLDTLPPSDPELRAELNILPLVVLQSQLKELDPDYYQIIDRDNPRRLIRAIEVCRLTGRKYSELRKQTPANRGFSFLLIGIKLPRAEIYKRIDDRVEQMIRAGLKQEALSLFPYRHLPALKSVGYSEWFLHFENRITEEEAIRLIKRNSRHYAKRQLTWFRKMNDIRWISPDTDVLFSLCDTFIYTS